MEPSTIHDHATTKSLVSRYFSSEGHGWDAGVVWSQRTARAGDFVMENVEAPDFWSDNAVGVTAKLYFATVNGERESSVKQMIERVAYKITTEGTKHGYFDYDERAGWAKLNGAALVFYDELCYLLVHQMAAFNTPVWLNVGVPGRRQVASACYLLGVDDRMLGDHSIMDWIQTEASIFKSGAGSGANLSNLRSSAEPLSTGGMASGPTSYMRSADANAGTLRSGGAHRRAAKMVCLDADHPDIEDFIDLKRREDHRMRALAEAGFEIDPFTPTGEKTIAESTSGQNSNNSVVVTHEFMRRAIQGVEDWPLTARKTGDVVSSVDANDLLDDISDAAWSCGDPGMIFIDRVNASHTTPIIRGEISPISTCNPCGESWLNDDSACNLSSLNLAKFFDRLRPDDRQDRFSIESFRRAVDVMILAMDITCSFSDLPTPTIERNTRELRQLGLGYANLGGVIMQQGLAYDSDKGRDLAASITALLTGRAYARSAEIAERMGAYALYSENEESHQGVIASHINAIPIQDYSVAETSIWKSAEGDWMDAASASGGFRNSQVTVIAPTGTISIMLDCDTSGCEPEFSLVRHKGIAGGGSMTFTSGSAESALLAMGVIEFDARELVEILAISGVDDFLIGLPPDVDSGVFDCANDISVDGHIKMVAAIQPFLSGAASKTINLPESATREDVRNAYVMAWDLGCKCISVYRDGSKVTQVLSAKPAKKTSVEELASIPTTEPGGAPQEPYRRRLPRERHSTTYKLTVDGHEGYVTAGRYDEGDLGEIFLTGVGKEGSFLQGMMGAWSIAVSVGLQYGVPLEVLAAKFIGMEFEPKGFTSSADIPEVKSIPDYVFRWLAAQHLTAEQCDELGVLTPEVKQRMTERLDKGEYLTQESVARYGPKSKSATESAQAFLQNGHALTRGTKPCSCGALMVSTGTCYTCNSCGLNTGCG